MVLHWRNSLCYRARSRGKSAQKVSWTHKDPSTVALVGWKAVERRVCVGAEARRSMVERGGGGARVVVVAAEWGDTGCRESRSVLKEGKPVISACGPGRSRQKSWRIRSWRKRIACNRPA